MKGDVKHRVKDLKGPFGPLALGQDANEVVVSQDTEHKALLSRFLEDLEGPLGPLGPLGSACPACSVCRRT